MAKDEFLTKRKRCGIKLPLPPLLGMNPLLNNRSIALIADRTADEIEVSDRGSEGGFVYERSKARLTFFNETPLTVVEAELLDWPASIPIVELEVPACPSRHLLTRIFGQRFDVSEVQILSFKRQPRDYTRVETSKVSIPSPEAVGLVQEFHRETLRSLIAADKASTLISGSSRDFFEAHVNGHSVAIAALTRKVGEARCFSFFYVNPNYRRMGIGEALFAQVLTAGLKDNVEIFLHVDSSNLPALRVYSKFFASRIGAYLNVKISHREEERA